MQEYTPRRVLIREASQEAQKEVVDPVPVEIPLSNQRPPSLKEEMMRYIRQEISNQARDKGHETFEEFDDFSDDEPEMALPPSPYTVQMEDVPGGAYLYPEDEKAAEGLSGAPEASTMPPESPHDEPGLASAEPARESEGRNSAGSNGPAQQ